MKEDDPSRPRRDFLRQSLAAIGGVSVASATGLAGLSALFSDDAAAADTPATDVITRARRELIMFHGQSNAVGTGGRAALTLQEIYANVTFNGGVRPGTDPTAMTRLAPLVE